VSALSKRECRRLAGLVALQTGRVPSFDARNVLHQMLLRFAEGREIPSQEAFAAELGLAERTLRERLGELRRCGLVLSARQGNRPAQYTVILESLRAWLRGEVDFDDLSGEICPTNVDLSGEIGATNAGLSGRNCPAPSRARVLGGGGGDRGDAAGDVAAAVAVDAAVREAQQRSVQVLRSNGVPMPYAMQLRLRVWLERGLQVEDVEAAATEAALNAAKGFGYVERILERMHREAVGERVVEFEEYRGVKPWTGVN
jgi:hypothetical protein